MFDIKITTELVQLKNNLGAYSERFPEHINNIDDLEKDFLSELQRIEADEQHLSIGIMGQVKAGKSSFLNALLFDGKPILPEAATPKTANLTRISYGEHPHLVVHYYSPEEWAEFTREAESESDGVRARIARGILEMVRLHGVDAAETIERRQEAFSAASLDELMGRLNDYVGENGRYTALVKFTEILLPLPELDGFEIIDTPGMNDPVPSRTQKTRDYMAKCDVVFFLSRCSQFLDQSDMDLLAQQLPAKGVKRMVLVAGQLDGVIADDGFDRASLAETEGNVRARLVRRAESEIERLSIAREKLGDPDVAKLLRGLKTPILSSTYAHGYAHWEESRWGKGMRHMHQQLAELAEQSWDGYRFTLEDWARLGNFGALKVAYEQARLDKLPLMQARRDDLLPRMQANLSKVLGELMTAAEHRLAQLKFGDIRAIEAGAIACEAQMTGIANRLGSTINVAIEQAQKTAAEIKMELRREVDAAASVRTQSGTKKETEKYTISTSKWYNPFTWGDTETIEETTYVTYEYIATADAVERLVNYGNESAANLSRAFNNIISMSTLRADLKHALIEELNTGSQEFDPAEFRNTLESALNSLKLPELKLDIGDCGQLISGKFSGKVRSERKMEELRRTLRESLALVFDKLLTGFDAALKKLCGEFDRTRDSLAQKLTASLQGELDQLRKDFANKEAEIKQYEELIKICQAAGAKKGATT
ncbi:dynamin family protein [Azonexus sp.]|uniref:dynamin family protein n=1 Tax=Azonexus sp. TaxID=1872668 RepID=UPI0027BAFB92|nr:dynamin family protein [Azonexus sp.]